MGLRASQRETLLLRASLAGPIGFCTSFKTCFTVQVAQEVCPSVTQTMLKPGLRSTMPWSKLPWGTSRSWPKTICVATPWRVFFLVGVEATITSPMAAAGCPDLVHGAFFLGGVGLKGSQKEVSMFAGPPFDTYPLFPHPNECTPWHSASSPIWKEQHGLSWGAESKTRTACGCVIEACALCEIGLGHRRITKPIFAWPCLHVPTASSPDISEDIEMPKLPKYLNVTHLTKFRQG